jgi:hypothetical protein
MGNLFYVFLRFGGVISFTARAVLAPAPYYIGLAHHADGNTKSNMGRSKPHEPSLFTPEGG